VLRLWMPRKKATDKMFNPEKYQMNFCHGCRRLETFIRGER